MLNRQHIDPGLYRDAMSRYAGHVQLVTTAMEGMRRGVTITAACSVSDNPASVLICLNNTNPKNEIFFRSGIFVLNTLGRTALADDARFGSARFETLVTGAPVLADALAAFDCRVTDIKEMPTHNVIFGEVAAVRFSEKHPALLYMNRDYHAL
ncbi:flavin reductase-like protein [Rhizobium sp. CIAT894]|uniref:flavin reductase n=1 Tax=Rhizobium sp. CIAT894 TaxID=2020312 RepID=UPI000A1D847B|nr:flavin reductase [Rhizobium sp. CIAT894]ARM88612.1 flavin reductase-like protein [Rhizobium sp. CIAT894]